MKRFSGMAAAGWTLALAASGALAQARMEPIQFRANDGTVVEAERGEFGVPEDRADPASRLIPVGFVRFRSTAAEPSYPTVYLAGGPGAPGSATAAGPRFPMFMALREVGDVIAFDQRGTGAYNRVPRCRVSAAPDPAQPMTRTGFTAYYRAAHAECWAFWRDQGVAVGGYDTEQSADDIEALRRALGARRINLVATSYGSHLALAYMKRHPRSVNRVVLSSAEGLEQTVKHPARVEAALARLAVASGRPDLPDVMRRVHARLDAEPAILTHRTADGAEIRMTLTAFPVQLMAAGMVKNPSDFPRLAGFYAALDAGQYAPLTPVIYRAFFGERMVLTGMPEAMDLASGISAARLAEVEAAAGGTALGAALSYPMPDIVGAVPGADLGEPFRAPFRHAAPTLLFSGDLDVRTPMEEQAEAVAGLRNLTRIVVRNGGHDLFETSPDIPRLMTTFLRGRAILTAPVVLPAPRR